MVPSRPAARSRRLRALAGSLHAELVGDGLGKALVDIQEMRHHALANCRGFDLGKLKGQRHGDMTLLRRGLAVEKLARLAVVVGEALGTQTNLWTFLCACERPEPSLWRFTRAFTKRVWLIVHATNWIAHCHVPILLEMGEGTLGCVDRNMREIGATEPLQLRVEIGEVATLKQRVVGEVDARRDVLRHERNLLGLREEIVGHAIENQASDWDRLEDLFGNNLGRIEHVEVEVVRKLLIEELHSQLPFREVSGTESHSTDRGDESRDRRR